MAQMCRSDAIPNLDWLMLSGNRLSNLAVCNSPLAKDTLHCTQGILLWHSTVAAAYTCTLAKIFVLGSVILEDMGLMRTLPVCLLCTARKNACHTFSAELMSDAVPTLVETHDMLHLSVPSHTSSQQQLLWVTSKC